MNNPMMPPIIQTNTTQENRPNVSASIPDNAPKRPNTVIDEQTGEEPDRDDFSGFEYIVSVEYGAGYHENNWSQVFIHPAPARQLYDLVKSQVGVNNVITCVSLNARTVGDWVNKFKSHNGASDD